MNLSNFNLSTVLMIAIAMALAYVAIKFFSNLISKVICFTIGVLLLIFVLTQLGISIPVLSEVVSYLFGAIKIAFENLHEILAKLK